MNRTRSQIDDAVVAQVQKASWTLPDGSTQTWELVSKHFRLWSDTGDVQPCAFVRRMSENIQQQKGYGLDKYTLTYQIWIYLKVDNNNVASDPYDEIINPVMDAVDNIFAPMAPNDRNNLGGLVDNAHIGEKVEIHDGMDDGQAVILMPLQVFTGV